MIIRETKPVSMVEVKDILDKKKDSKDERIKNVRKYVKKFIKVKEADSEKLREELGKLGLIKLKEKHIVKIIDLVPKESEDLRKIFASESVSLNQEEMDKILNVTSKIKTK
jgi:DNA-directed RNA polymerase subunit F